MNFNEFIEAKEYPVGKPVQAGNVPLTPQYPVAKGVSQVNPSNPATWPKEEVWRIRNAAMNGGNGFNPPEKALFEKQQQERRLQKQELQEYGVILTPITPFKLNGGQNLQANPIWNNLR